MLGSERAEAVGVESDFSAEDGMEEAASPASQSLTPSLSASPPPPPVSIGARWAADIASLRRNIPNMHCRVQAVNSALSYSDSESCPQCRERYAAFKRNNSVRSAGTINSYGGSNHPRKGGAYTPSSEFARSRERSKPKQRRESYSSCFHVNDETYESKICQDLNRMLAKPCRAPRLQRMQAEDEDSCPVILERDFHSLHRNVPALRRRDVDTSAIRQHYYPEGGWGWIICGAGFIVHLFTTGLQLSFGLLYLHTLHHVGEEALMDAAWVGPLCLAVSLFATPLVVAICRRKSTRLTAILGGLVMALGCLFTSFAHQLHQIMLSYGIVMGVGVSMVRETSSLMLGHYFKRRREFVEMVSQAGAGVGITLISVFYKEAVGKLGWRLGLQAVTGVLSLTFFLGILYRSASLYHPQRRAILHLKNQKKKIKEKKGHRKAEKPPLLDFSPLKIRAVQVLLLSSGTAAFGLYTPVFYLALQGYKEGLEHSTLVLLETFLGFATALGCVGFGLIILRPSENCLVSRQYLCQAALIGISISLLALSTVQGYHGYSFFVWLYGICLGGFSYSLKMFTMESVKARYFTKTWGFVQGVEAIPILLGVPITGYINQSHPKAGYYFSFFSVILGTVLFYFVGMPKKEEDDIPPLPLPPHATNNNPRASICICPPISPRHYNPRTHIPKSISFATTLDLPDFPPFPRCMSRERLPEYLLQSEYLHPGGLFHHRQLRSCKSVPEGLAACNWQYRNPRDIQVIEQMTTSV